MRRWHFTCTRSFKGGLRVTRLSQACQTPQVDSRPQRGIRDVIRQTAGRIYDLIPGKRFMLQPLRPLRLPHRLYQHLHFTGPFTVSTPKGSFRVMHHGNEIENEDGPPGRRERVSMNLWMHLAPLARVILDVGANSGVYSLVAAAMNPHATVYGFEPVPKLFAQYMMFCPLNSFDIQPMCVALSNRNGSAQMRGITIDPTLGNMEVQP